MTEIPLPPDSASADNYVLILENLIERYNSTDKPVKYSEAALGGIANTTASTVLGYWSNIGVIEVEKQGVYTPIPAIVEYYSENYDPTSDAIHGVKSVFDDYELYREALFVIDRGEYENKSELADEIISLEDELDEDSKGDVIRGLETLELLNLLHTDFPSAESEDSDSVVSDEADSNGGTVVQRTDGEIEYSNVNFAAEDLPRYATPQKLLGILGVMESGGTWSAEEIEGRDSIEMEKREVNGTLGYGLELGFIDEVDEGYTPTRSGFDLYYARDETERFETLLREAVRDYQPYVIVLEALFNKSVGSKEKDSLTNDDLISLFRTEFGFTGTSKDTLKRSIDTLFETLSSIGYGKKISGRGQKTRLEFDNFDNLDSIIDEICIGSAHSSLAAPPKEDRTEYPDSEKEQKSAETDTHPEIEVGQDGGEGGLDEEGSSRVRGESTTDDQFDTARTSDNVNIDINIDINLSDLDTAELEAKLKLLNNYLN